MILTGRKLEEIGRALYGETWACVISLRLRRHRKTIYRWRDDATAKPSELRAQLLALVEDQIVTLANYAAELRDGPGCEP